MRNWRIKRQKFYLYNKLCCENRGIAKAYILHWQLKEPQVVTLTNGCGYFKAYSKDYTVILCDTGGNCYTDDYQDEALLQPENYLEKCMELAPEELSYLLYYFDGKKDRRFYCGRWKIFSDADTVGACQ